MIIVDTISEQMCDADPWRPGITCESCGAETKLITIEAYEKKIGYSTRLFLCANCIVGNDGLLSHLEKILDICVCGSGEYTSKVPEDL